jgi:hypothetical protein
VTKASCDTGQMPFTCTPGVHLLWPCALPSSPSMQARVSRQVSEAAQAGVPTRLDPEQWEQLGRRLTRLEMLVENVPQVGGWMGLHAAHKSRTNVACTQLLSVVFVYAAEAPQVHPRCSDPPVSFIISYAAANTCQPSCLIACLPSLPACVAASC